MRSTLIPLVAATLIMAMVLPVFAQETADISLGGGLVARLRDRGTFATIAERAANVDQKLVEVVSGKDTQNPQVSVKQRGNLWTVYAWDVPVVSVCPAEAKTNKMGEKQLAEVWARNLTQQLPKATPCSKLPREQLGYGAKPAATASTKTATTAPAGSVAAKPATAAPPAKVTATTQPPAAVTTKPTTTKPATTTAAKPPATASKPAAAAAPTKPATTAAGSEAGALLLIVAAMGTARELNDQDWAARKEAVARELYTNLSYYIAGSAPPPKPVTTPPPKPATPTTTTKPAAATTTTPPKPAATPSTAKPATPAATTKPPATVTTDPSMAKVPQKNRIRAKFAAAKPAYDKLVQTDPEAAGKVSDILAASRQAFAYGNFDESEQKVDEALAALGVVFKE